MARYADSFYIVAQSIDDLKIIAASTGKAMTDTAPRLTAIQPRLEAGAKGGGYFIEIDRDCEKLLDALNADPALKRQLLTNEQAQALADNSYCVESPDYKVVIK